MARSGSRSLLTLGGLLLAAGVLRPAGILSPKSPAVAAPAAVSVRWKTSVTSSEARPGDRLQEAEIWLVGARMRIEDRTPGIAPRILLLTEGAAYMWSPGGTVGARMGMAVARQSGRPTHDYPRILSEIRARGRLVGAEPVDGHACDVVEYESPEDGKGTYWLARDLRDFPLRIRVERPGVFLPNRAAPLTVVKLEYRNRDVRFPAGIDAAELAPPPNVRFEDASEILLNKGRPFPR